MDTKNFATKSDIKRLDNTIKEMDKKMVTKSMLNEAVDAILTGMDNMFEAQNKRNDDKFATKKDLRKLETKVDFIRDDIRGLEGELASIPTRAELTKLQSSLAA